MDVAYTDADLRRAGSFEPERARLLAALGAITAGGIVEALEHIGSTSVPELVLLFKSKNTGDQERGKDQADFDRVQRRLEPERRAWLRWALAASQPGHPWLWQLEQADA